MYVYIRLDFYRCLYFFNDYFEGICKYTYICIYISIGEELMYTIRTFAIGAWVILLFVIGLCLVDAYMYLTFHWLTAVSYVLRLFAIFIYGVVAVQCISLWNSYTSRKETICIDIMLASFLALIYSGIVVGFVMVIVKSEQNAWRIIYF
jgi:hypothetical protein